MDSGNVSAVISAVAGISGVVLGNLLVAIKEYVTSRSKRKENIAYLCIVAVSHLEGFADACAGVASDDGTESGRPAGDDGQEHAVTTRAPEFRPFEFAVDWKLLPKKLMFPILCLPEKQRQLQDKLSQISEYEWDPPCHTEYFWTRRRGYAEFGLMASRLARELRDHAGMPHEGNPSNQSRRDDYLKNVVETIDSKREAHLQRQKVTAEL
ncbi:hypothetical protein [Pseudomonas sp. JR33AA]|uniref:hypothetical protein n=1 Tax=Pseudomonas sp. JR33AA TaxID=2899113 RepID=UPI001F1C53F9|nr:hypothetical protein [Pseudomonas sp. JR33AA]MCE5978538.1 hypothetical protein [Pseudomonas sp. JR33AA]